MCVGELEGGRGWGQRKKGGRVKQKKYSRYYLIRDWERTRGEKKIAREKKMMKLKIVATFVSWTMKSRSLRMMNLLGTENQNLKNSRDFWWFTEKKGKSKYNFSWYAKNFDKNQKKFWEKRISESFEILGLENYTKLIHRIIKFQ